MTACWPSSGRRCRGIELRDDDELNEEINAALANPQIKARLADLDAAALAGSLVGFGKLIAEESEKWGKVIKFVGIKLDRSPAF